MDITHITSLLGGIALFLYGMSIMGAGLEKLAGGKMQGVLQKADLLNASRALFSAPSSRASSSRRPARSSFVSAWSTPAS